MSTNAPDRVSIRTRVSRGITRFAVASAALGVLAACASAPLSYINDRQVYYKAVLNRYPVFVTAVDGSSSTFRPMPITAGQHNIAFEAQPVAGFSQPLRKVYPMTIAPCTRYYVAAQRTSPLEQDWNLVVEQTWPVAGCNPDAEIEKGRQAAAAGKQPPMTSAIESLPTAAPLALQSR